MRTFTITFIRQMFPWSEPYNTTRTIEAKDWSEACVWAEEYADKNTRIVKCQGGGETFVGKTTIASIK